MSKKKQTKQQQPEAPPPPPQQTQGEGTIYEGNWMLVNGVKMKHGYGRLVVNGTSADQIQHQYYNGNWLNDKMHGYGTYVYSSGAMYEGQWRNGKQHGFGKYSFTNGAIYQGEWQDHRMHGTGRFFDRQGRVWQSLFQRGVYKSKLQREMNERQQIKIKEACIIQQSKALLAVAQAPKLKQALLAVLPSSQDIRNFCCTAKIRLQERSLELWKEALTAISKEPDIRVLHTSQHSKVLDGANLRPQLSGVGQVVEWRGGGWTMVSIQTDSKKWKIFSIKQQSQASK